LPSSEKGGCFLKKEERWSLDTFEDIWRHLDTFGARAWTKVGRIQCIAVEKSGGRQGQ